MTSTAQIDAPSPSDDIAAHASAYHGFMLGVKWMCIHLAAVLVLLVIAFCTSAGLLAGLIAGLIVLGGGVYAMTHGLSHSTEQDNPGSLSVPG